MIARLNWWWSAPCGLREVLKIATPLIISTSSWTLMVFTDRVFLLWYSRDAVAAAMPAGALAFTIICFPLGVALYTNTFVAQYHGAGRPERISLPVWQGVFLGALMVPLALVLNPFSAQIFSAAQHGAEIAPLEASYFCALNFGGGATVISAAASSFFTGRGNVRVVMLVDSLAAGLNILLDWLWIFGRAGFPEYGIEGAAWATVVALWFKALFYLALWLGPTFRQRYQPWRSFRLDWPMLSRLLRFGFPNGVQFLLEVGAFTAFLMLVGRLGALELAATTLAFNVNTLAFMPVWGIATATATLVGQKLGEDLPDLAARAVWTSFAIATALMAVVGSIYLFAPGWLLSPHAQHVPAEEFEQIEALTSLLLRFVAFYCLFDAMNLIFASAIKGAGDTRFVLHVTLFLSGFPVLFTWLGLTQWGLGLLWSWGVVTTWVCLLGVAFFLRFLQGAWRTMRVIEVEGRSQKSEVSIM